MEKALSLLAEYTKLNHNWLAYLRGDNVIPTLKEVKDYSAKETFIKNELNELGFYMFFDSSKPYEKRYNLKFIATNIPIDCNLG